MSLEDEIVKLKESIDRLCEKFNLDYILLDRKEIKNNSDLSEQNKIIKEFYDSPDKALFNEKVIALIRGCSVALMQRDRWAGNGIPFKKMGNKVLYCKADVIKWLSSQKSFNSTKGYK